jgi:hypothetical protein
MCAPFGYLHIFFLFFAKWIRIGCTNRSWHGLDTILIKCSVPFCPCLPFLQYKQFWWICKKNSLVININTSYKMNTDVVRWTRCAISFATNSTRQGLNRTVIKFSFRWQAALVIRGGYVPRIARKYQNCE